MKRNLIATGLVVALASCTTTQFDNSIQKNLPIACNTFATGYATYLALVPSGKISKSRQAKVEAAANAVQPICADPSKVTAANALIIAANAYTAVVLALKEAD